ncbi:MAG: 50S ribosomal protein L13 [Candidatus Heimdallarchaeaceae archaeon]
MSKEMKLKNTKRSLTTINIDADGAILGRMCSEVAKYLLEGYSVNIVNCEKAIISGKRQSILEEYRELHKKHTLSNPRRGPFHSKRPDRVVRRTVRGMLPWKKSKGKTAYHKLLTYIGIPEKLKDSEIVKPKFADSSKLKCNKITVGELCKGFGWS